MNNSPRNERGRKNLIESLKEQVKGLKTKILNLDSEEKKIFEKIRKLEYQQGLFRKNKEEISLLIEKYNKDLADLEKLTFPINPNSVQEIENRLKTYNYTFKDYEEGLVPPTIQRELGIPVKPI